MTSQGRDWSAALAEFAADQWGLLTRRQLDQVGVPSTTADRLVAPGGRLVRVASGVYRVLGAPEPDHLALRAAWLQLAPATPAWERTMDQGVISHRSAAAAYGIGDLAADIHEFTVPSRKQTRRSDVRIHVRRVSDSEVRDVRGLPVTRPARIAADLLGEREDPEAIGRIVADALDARFDQAAPIAGALAGHAHRYGFERNDGVDMLGWLLDLSGAPDAGRWVAEARTHAGGTTTAGGGRT